MGTNGVLRMTMSVTGGQCSGTDLINGRRKCNDSPSSGFSGLVFDLAEGAALRWPKLHEF